MDFMRNQKIMEAMQRAKVNFLLFFRSAIENKARFYFLGERNSAATNGIVEKTSERFEVYIRHRCLTMESISGGTIHASNGFVSEYGKNFSFLVLSCLKTGICHFRNAKKCDSKCCSRARWKPEGVKRRKSVYTPKN